ncbi:cadmium-induced protein AS8 [Euphorbia lathyris]|uniref:cadmium-induced protein AS8 n=1 Tax=Euphorbia lathyris TaxID=212925 RepID=UPI0033140E30
MIIKGLFRRYERWNPVHPTSGAFWGMGLGIGCGVGWGPGFGPEVVGYVGAGCGVGFSVGITFAGLGIGLPANYVFQLPYNGIVATRRHALAFIRSSGIGSEKDATWYDWNNVAPGISELQRETSRRLSSFKGVDLRDMQSNLCVHTKSISEDFRTFCCHLLHPRKGPKD